MENISIKKGDQVLVTAGRDKGKTGKVLTVNTKVLKAVVDGVNIYKKHVKPSSKYPQGGIIDKNVPIVISNLAVVCPACQKPTRIGYKNTGRDKRRFCKKCGEVVDAS